MKRNIILQGVVLGAVLFLSVFNFATAGAPDCQTYCDNPSLGPPAGVICYCNPSTYNDIEDIINGIEDWIFKMAMILAPVLIVIGGVIFLTAGGNTGRIKLAKSILTWTVVGFTIVIFAKGLMALVDYIIGIK